MKRVLHILGGLDRGGAESFILNAWRNIDRDKYQFDIITFMKPRNGKKFAYEDELIRGGAKIYRIEDNRIKAPWKFQNDIAKIVKDGKYSIIHSHIDFMSALSLAGARKGGATALISHSHNTLNANLTSWPKKFVYSILRKRLLSVSRKRLACGQKAGEFLYGEKNDFTVIPNGINFANFSFSDTWRKKLREEYGIGKKSVVFLNVGRLEKVKNQAWLIQVFEKALKKGGDYYLFIIGDGSLKDTLTDQINSSPAKNRIFLLSSRDTINQYYSLADVFVLPSTFEGVPTVGIEAQASGLRCIFSNLVPSEVAASDNCAFLPLQQSTWVRAFSAKYPKINRVNAPQSDKIQVFNIKNSVKQLEAVYDSFDHS